MITRFTVGRCAYTLLNTGHFDMDPAVLFAGVPADERAAAGQKYGLADHLIVFQINPLLVEIGANRVLIDPGSLSETPVLPSILREAGIDPDSIDTVIITHAHFDHHRECADPTGSPAFPNARYTIQRTEWEYWAKDGENPEPGQAEAFRKILLPLRDNFTLLDGDEEIIPGIQAIYAPGHSPGHMAVLIDDRLIHLGDAAVCVVYTDHPDWVASFDLWPEQVVQSRRKLFLRIANENLLAVFSHHAPPGPGRITANGEAWQWEPI